MRMAWIWRERVRRHAEARSAAAAGRVLTVSVVALIGALWLQLVRSNPWAALGTIVLAPVPLGGGTLLLADWSGIASAWSDRFYTDHMSAESAGRFSGSVRSFQHGSIRFWGVLLVVLGLVMLGYGLDYLVRDLA